MMQPILREGLLVSEILPPCQPEQLRLIPAARQVRLPSYRLAYFISNVVDQLDLGQIPSRY